MATPASGIHRSSDLTERKFFTEQDLAVLTGRSVAAWRRDRQLNQGPRFLRLGRNVRYPRDDFQKWVDEQPSGGGNPINN